MLTLCCWGFVYESRFLFWGFYPGRVCGLTCSTSIQCELHLISFRRKATPWESVCVSVHVRACAVIMSCLEHCHSVCLLGVRQTGREFCLQDRGLQCSQLQLCGSWLGPQGGVPQWPACLVSKAEAEVRDDECMSALYTVHLPLAPEVKWPWAYFMSLPVTSVASILQVDGEVEKEQCGKARSCFLLSSSAQRLDPHQMQGLGELGKGGQSFPYLVGPGSRAGSWTGFRVRHYFLLFPYPWLFRREL